MGWNEIDFSTNSKIFDGINDSEFILFILAMCSRDQNYIWNNKLLK